MGLEPTPTQEVWFGLLAVREQLVDALDEQLRARHELPLSAFVVLVTLVKHDEPVAVSSLAPMVSLVSRSQVSRLVDALSARGLVARARGTGDGRVHAVRITDAGRALAADGLRCADDVAERLVVARLPAAELRALRRALGRLTGYPPEAASGARRNRPGGA